MRGMKRALGALLATLLLGGAMAGCGVQHPTAAVLRHRAQERAAEQRQKAAAQRRQHQSALYQECKAVTGTVDQRLTALASRMEVGMQFADYSNAVGSARVAWDRMLRAAKARGGISDECIHRVGDPLQHALNAYISADQTWNKCNSDYACSLDRGSAHRTTQRAWAKAQRLSSRADSALSAMQPTP